MKHIFTKIFQYLWQAITIISFYLFGLPELWIGWPMILAVFFLVLDIFTPKKQMSQKQTRILTSIFLPIVVIVLAVAGVYNLNANLYTAWHILPLIVIVAEIFIRAYSIFRPEATLLKLFQDPNVEVAK